jgi:hypothetical protein
LPLISAIAKYSSLLGIYCLADTFGTEYCAFQFAIKNLKIKIYRTIILPVVLYGCETWSLKFREERKPKVLENRVLGRLFGPKKDDVTREWRKLHNVELNYHYYSPNIVRVIKSGRMIWVGHVACIGVSKAVYRVLMGKPEGKSPLGRSRCRREDNMKMDLQK